MNTNFDFSGRLAKLYDKLSAEEVDAVLITKVVNVTYLSGFGGDSYIAALDIACRRIQKDTK